MKARTIGVHATIPAVVGVEVAVIAAILAFPPARMSWWPTVAVGVIAAAALLVTVHRRNMIRWLVDRMRWWRRRRRNDPPAAAIDIPHGASLYGVRVPDRFDGEAITMIEVTGQAYSPTLLTGSATALTPNLLPLDALTGLLDQPGGIRLSGIDVVSSGLRVRRGTGYPPLYSTLLADRPAAGQRRTYLVVRLDIANSVAGLAYRSTVGAAAAAATERIVNALLQRGVRANALTAKDLDAALVELGAGLAVVPAEAGPDAVPVGARTPTPVAPTETWKFDRGPSRLPDLLLLLPGGRHHQHTQPDVGAAFRRCGADDFADQEAWPDRRPTLGVRPGAGQRPSGADPAAHPLPQSASGSPGSGGGAFGPAVAPVRCDAGPAVGRRTA